MLKLYTDFLDKNRLDVWRKLGNCSDMGSLAGGTALALLLNHRKSFDFDIFSDRPINKNLLLKAREIFGANNIEIVIDSEDELSILYKDQIRMSFVYFPFKPLHPLTPTYSLQIFNVRDLLSNKAYAVGRRGAWRDYADIYWCLKKRIVDLPNLILETKKRFLGIFSEKLFLEQLVYFEDINDFAIEWIGKKVGNDEIKKYLINLVHRYLEEKC